MATILIVDDQPDNLYVLERLLRGKGYQVLQAENGPTALQIAGDKRPDLVLLDVMMPNMDGFEVVQRMRDDETTRLIPVVLLTANAPDERLKIQGLKLGADEYLTQPINNNELLARVQALLRTKQTQDALQARNAQLTALLDIVQASTSTLELTEVGRRLVERAVTATGMDMGGLWLQEDAGLLCLAESGYSAGITDAGVALIVDNTPIAIRVLQNREVVHGRPTEVFGADSPLAHNGQTAIVLPLIHRETVLGFLHLGCSDVSAPDADGLTFLKAIANAAAVAVQNARLFEETDRQRQQLERLDSEKDEFISIVSHELKNPLASIKGYAGLLQRRAKKDKALQSALKGLEVIEQQVNRMTTLLDQLRDVSQIGMDRFMIEAGPLDIAELTQRIAFDMQTTSNDHEINIDVHDEPLMINADEFRMSQVLGNLMSNAIKYSPQGGVIDVVVQQSSTPPQRPHDMPAGDYAVITVRDRGIGIPRNVQEYLFQRFFRAPNTQGRISGMGLGLYITREILQRHGGYVWLESEEGEGSMFGIALPLLNDATATDDTTQQLTAEPVAEPTS
jgi:signal transduction histidine kinase